MLLLAFSCYSPGGDTPDRQPADTARDSQPADSADSADSGPGHTGDTTDTHTETGVAEGIQLVSTDDAGLANIGLQVRSYTINRGYTTNDGELPKFHLVAEEGAFADGASHPLLVWLHGGVIGIAGDEEEGTFCTWTPPKTFEGGGIPALVDNAIYNHDHIFAMAAERGWAVMVPESTWCDLWQGRGAEDPVADDHMSLFHIEQILDGLEAGETELETDPSQVFAWGTSIGGLGVLPVSWGSRGDGARFAGVVSDSGPVWMTDWVDNPTYTDILAHILGDAPYDDKEQPTDTWDTWARVDAPLLMGELGYRVPVFHTYNTYDGLTPVSHGDAMKSALVDHYGTSDRWFSYDLLHHAPGNDNHTQTQNDRPPMSYTSAAAVEFLAGRSVSIYEAEATCDPGFCNLVNESDDEGYATYSQGVATARDESQGPGSLYRGLVPPTIPRGVAVDLMLVITGDDFTTHPESSAVLDIDLRVDGKPIWSRALLVGDLAWEADADVDQVLAHHAATTISTVLPAGDIQLALEGHGRGSLWFDAVWVLTTD